MKKRSLPKQWILFESSTSGDLYISNQKGTPLYELEKLSHFRGAYQTISGAERAGIARLRRKIELANEMIGQLSEQATELERKQK